MADPHDPILDILGGPEGCRRLSEAFYSRVPMDPLIGRMFPKNLHCAIPALAAFLSQLLGGPNEYSVERGALTMREAHAKFKIGRAERAAWLAHMQSTLDELGIDGPNREELNRFFERAAADLVNDEEKPQVDCAGMDGLGDRWDRQLAWEEAVAAARAGDAENALTLAGSPPLCEWLSQDAAADAALLGVMCSWQDPAFLGHVYGRMASEPELATVRYAAGRTLLHDAAAGGCVPVVEMLLHHGADPNAIDFAGHAPLYFVGNQCAAPAGDEVVRLLVDAGASVDASGGVKDCTALHMAARRGYVHVAMALLDCGAVIEARDSLGETPLRRAVNCRQPEMVERLLARGADPDSVGSKGLTPRTAARSAAIKALFERVLQKA